MKVNRALGRRAYAKFDAASWGTTGKDSRKRNKESVQNTNKVSEHKSQGGRRQRIPGHQLPIRDRAGVPTNQLSRARVTRSGLGKTHNGFPDTNPTSS